MYVGRVLRGTGPDGFYSIRKLGAVGDGLGAVACLFEEPWHRPAPSLKEGGRAWLLNEAAFYLRALGRLGEALEPMRQVSELDVEQGRSKEAAVSYGNLSELELTLGAVDEAVADAERAVDYAERSENAFLRMGKRSTLADALHQRGEAEAARGRFAEAEAVQAEWQPDYPLLYSQRGFRYCDLLLAEVERGAWGLSDCDSADLLKLCDEVEKRGRKWFEWRAPNDSLLDIAHEELTLGRCALYRARLQKQVAGAEHIEKSVEGLRASGQQHELPRGLLTRAWLRHASNDETGAAADLDEAWRIASRGGMKLFMADIHLYRARLFQQPEHLGPARKLIEECNYGRRLPELEAAEAALGVDPAE